MASKFESFLVSRKFKKIMAKVYGFGATVVLIGALFKIQHWPGAGPMLIAGLGTEAMIFFISAFEPPHEEPDWSLVYPELAGHDDAVDMLEVEEEEEEVSTSNEKGITKKLDDMLEEANINEELLMNLSKNLGNLSEGAAKLSDVTAATAATDEFVSNVKAAAGSAGELKGSYDKTSQALSENLNVEELSTSMKNASDSYNLVSETLTNDLDASEQFSQHIRSAANSAEALANQYVVSTEKLVKSTEALDLSDMDSSAYVEQLKTISTNLSALNDSYQLQLESSNRQNEIANEFNSSVEQLKSNLDSSINDTMKFKEELAKLNENLTSLNQVYGNMLSAMSVRPANA